MRRALRCGAKIGQNGLSLFCEKDIAGLDVQMDDVIPVQAVESRDQSLKP
jgi:hypothetical protein